MKDIKWSSFFAFWLVLVLPMTGFWLVVIGGYYNVRAILAVGVLIFLPTFFGIGVYAVFDKINQVRRRRAKRGQVDGTNASD